MRKSCRQCPWTNDQPHSLKFRTYVEKMKKLQGIQGHKCHLVSTDVWGFSSPVNAQNICLGQTSQKLLEKIKI